MSVYKRYKGKRVKSSKDPNWEKATFYIYRRLRGQVIHKSLPEARTKAQAEQAERYIIEQVFSKRYGAQGSDNTTFNEFVDKTYSKYVAQNNVNVYVKGIFTRELKRFFGTKRLSDITAQDCRDYQYKRLHTKTRLDTKRSPSSVNKEMSTLSKIFTLACEEGKLEHNPMRYVKKLTEPPPRKRLLTVEEKESLWREIEKDPFLYPIVKLAVNLPLRQGQILAIEKESVDFENRILLAAASKGREPRLIPLNNTAIAVLKELCDKTRSGILIKLDGAPVKNFGKRWRNVLIRAGINKAGDTRENNYHFHDCRREMASELIRRNVNPLIIQDLYAHSDMNITKIYAQSDLGGMREAVNSLDEKVQESDAVN